VRTTELGKEKYQKRGGTSFGLPRKHTHRLAAQGSLPGAISEAVVWT